MGNEMVVINKGEVKHRLVDHQRIYLQLLTSMIEGISYRLRFYLLVQHRKKAIALTEDEQLVLKEDREKIYASNPKLRKHLNTLPLIKYTWKTFAKHYQKSKLFSEWVGMNEFASVKTTFEKRNLITHPKSTQDLFVSKEEVEHSQRAHDWFHSFFIAMLEGILIHEKESD